MSNSFGSLAVAPAAGVSADEDSVPEFMSFEQKIVEARRQLAHGPDPLLKTVEWRQIVHGLTPVERNPLAPLPPSWDSSPPSAFESDYFQFVNALDLKAFSVRVQRSGRGIGALRVLVLRIHACMLHVVLLAWFQVVPQVCNHYGILAIDAITISLFQHESDIVDESGMRAEMHRGQCFVAPWAAVMPPPGKGRSRPIGVKPFRLGAR